MVKANISRTSGKTAPNRADYCERKFQLKNYSIAKQPSSLQTRPTSSKAMRFFGSDGETRPPNQRCQLQKTAAMAQSASRPKPYQSRLLRRPQVRQHRTCGTSCWAACWGRFERSRDRLENHFHTQGLEGDVRGRVLHQASPRSSLRSWRGVEPTCARP